MRNSASVRDKTTCIILNILHYILWRITHQGELKIPYIWNLILGVVSQNNLAKYLINAEYCANIRKAIRGGNKRNRGHCLTTEAQKCSWGGWEV